jgi:cytoplasmic iron level regulating protein YaaA (DUF328/UPF0246 family)
MFALISPAKTLDYETPLKVESDQTPELLDDTTELSHVTKKLSLGEIQSLMSVSEKIADLNVERFQSWQPAMKMPEARPSLFAFKGDVYEGLDPHTLSKSDIKWLEKHLGILSGLYGLLKPMDLMLPYRLEMGTKLENGRGKNLYEFWGDKIHDAIESRLGKHPVLVNLASNEYAKAAKLKAFSCEVVTPQFKDWKNGQYKMISFYAKRARGLMLRYMVQNRITTPEGLLGFDLEDYHYNPELSSALSPVFTRKRDDGSN